MLDKDLAELYGIETKELNRAVKRNVGRFPEDFMFVLTEQETQNLRCQIGTSSWGGRRYLPYVFTEQGVAMLSSVLNSERAVQVNIAIMREFVKMREILATNKELARKLDDIEKHLSDHDSRLGRHAEQFRTVFEAIRQLMATPKPPESPAESPKRKIGF